MIYGDKKVRMKYPTFNDERADEWGCSFHHGKFIMKLREACYKQKSITVVEATCNDLICDSEDQNLVKGVSCTMKKVDGEKEMVVTEKVEYFAPLVVVADGCFSKFRKEVQSNDVFVRSHFVGYFLPDLPYFNYLGQF